MVEAVVFIGTWTLITVAMGMRDLSKKADKAGRRTRQVEKRWKALAKGKGR